MVLRWPDVPTAFDRLWPVCRRMQPMLRKLASVGMPQEPVGYYFEPIRRQIGITASGADLLLFEPLVKSAGYTSLQLLTPAEAADPRYLWVKLAYRLPVGMSPPTDFLPAYPDSPNRLTGALLSAACGAARGYYGRHDLAPATRPPLTIKLALDLLGNEFPLAGRYRRALARIKQANWSNTAVNIDAMGRTLWNAQASPQLTATTMGTLYAASQLPDPRAQPGIATSHQLGQLAAGAVGDYTAGLLAASALNQVSDWNIPPHAAGAATAALGIVGSVVPRLFQRSN